MCGKEVFGIIDKLIGSAEDDNYRYPRVVRIWHARLPCMVE